jgi:hypothetical protein
MMRLKTRALRIFPRAVMALVSILTCGKLAAAHDVALVTSKNSQVKVMLAADLTRIIKNMHKWPDGHDLIVVLTDTSSLEMRIVAQKLLSLTPEEFKKSIDATNKKRMTLWVVSSDDEVLKIVQSNTSAIGLVNVYSINSSVEVVKIDGKLPLEPGYVLHSQ